MTQKLKHIGRAATEAQKTSDTDELQQIGENTCGFCGLDGCFTSLLEKKSGNSIWKFTITSNCSYHYELMQYKMQQFLPTICHALMSQYILLFAPIIFREPTDHLEI